MVEIAISYDGELRCRAEHGPSGALIETDAPVDNHGRGAAFSPTDLAATSLGVCMMTVIAIAAQAKGVDLRGARVVVQKHMTTEPPRRIAAVGVEFFSDATPDFGIRAHLERVGRNCPVALSLHPDVEQTIQFHWGTNP